MMKKAGELLSKKGIFSYGTAKAGHLPQVLAPFSPGAILKDAQSVLCYAVLTPKGILHAETDFSLLYWRFCSMTYRFLDTVSNEICTMFEAMGHMTAPIYSCFPWKVQPGKFSGLLPLAYWAQECGLGRITRSGLLGDSRFGTRLLLGGVITTASLEANGKAADTSCPHECRLCQQACPVGAIEKSGAVDHNLCVRYSGANPLLANLLADEKIKSKFGFETLVNTVSVDDHGMYTCSKCLQECPLNR